MQKVIFGHFQGSTRSPTKRQIIFYWVVTVIIALESVAGGVADLMQEPGYIHILSHLGYPAYFALILGLGKVLATFAILVPRHPRLKEWAYAGLSFQFIGAIISHIIVGDNVIALIAPIIFLSLVIASWSLRPPSRRL
jgi:hypothetical protein